MSSPGIFIYFHLQNWNLHFFWNAKTSHLSSSFNNFKTGLNIKTHDCFKNMSTLAISITFWPVCYIFNQSANLGIKTPLIASTGGPRHPNVVEHARKDKSTTKGYFWSIIATNACSNQIHLRTLRMRAWELKTIGRRTLSILARAVLSN